jgi:hypothetical protein
MFGTKLAWQITHNSNRVIHFKLIKVHGHTKESLTILNEVLMQPPGLKRKF